MHRTILAVDIERFGSPVRTDRDRVFVRSSLYHALISALAAESIALTDCDHQNYGDGILVIIPPTVPKSLLVESLPDLLIAELSAHNEAHEAARQIRLRMAVHAGEVRYDDHGVVSTAINHAFRLLDAAVFKAAFARSAGPLGVIASAWFFEEVVRHSDGDARIAYRRIRVIAKETDTTAWVWLPGGATAPSPVAPSAPCQLPPASRHFVGREDELERLSAILDQHDAPTLVITAIAGTAGIGKTTLATRWANAVRHQFPDGQLHVDLRGFDSRAQLDPVQVLHGFLEALGVAGSAIPGDLGARSALYRSLVAERRMLVMLDNARTADQVRPLLPNSPTCLVLVTSRNRLDSLVVHEGAHRIELDFLSCEDAVELFASRVSPDRVTVEAGAITQLVEQCAGLPLALSIVAARAANQPNLPLHRLAEQLQDSRERLDLLNLGEQDMDIRAVVSWSYQTLSAPAARLFRLLGVHPGPDIDLLACQALHDDSKVGPLLIELTAAHLLEEHQPGRYRFHDLLRVYARERAEDDDPDLPAVRTRIADFYLEVMTVADCYIQPCRNGKIRSTPSPAVPPYLSSRHEAMAWFARENATLLAIVKFAAQNGLIWHVGQLAWTLHTFLNRTGQLHERAAVHRMGLDTATDDDIRLTFLGSLARALARLGRLDEAEHLLDEAAELMTHVPGHDRAIHLTYELVFELRGRHQDALHHARCSWEFARDNPNPQIQADSLTAIARHIWLDDAAAVLPLGDQALSLYREIGHIEGEAMALAALGHAHRQLRQYRQAIECFQQSLAIDRNLDSRYWQARELDEIGDLHDLLGEREQALAAWRRSAEVFESLHHPRVQGVRAKLNEECIP